MIREAVAFVLLGIACYTDIKDRRAPNNLWKIMLMAAALAIFVNPGDLWVLGFDLVLAAVSGFFFMFVYMTRIMGPADIKALICLQFLFVSIPFLSISVFVLSLILCLFLFPLAVFAYNAVETPKELMEKPWKGFTNLYNAAKGEWKRESIPFMVFIFIGLIIALGGLHL